MRDRTDLEKIGFQGFLPIQVLKDNLLSQVPDQPGVYAVLRECKREPFFLEKGSGGRFKKKDPNVTIGKLCQAWVPDTCIIYIGKAGYRDAGPTLRKRLQQYLDFGQGKAVGHWGGRYIWQLDDTDTLTVCWKLTPREDPEEVEAEIIDEFVRIHDRLPFANLKRGRRQCKS